MLSWPKHFEEFMLLCLRTGTSLAGFGFEGSCQISPFCWLMCDLVRVLWFYMLLIRLVLLSTFPRLKKSLSLVTPVMFSIF